MRPRMSKSAAQSCRRHKWRLVHRPWTGGVYFGGQQVEQCAYCGVERAALKGGAK